MDRRLKPRYNAGLAGADAPDVSSAEAAEAWILSLPPSIRSSVQTRLKSIALALPAAAQIALAQSIVNSGHELAVQLPLDGLGCPCQLTSDSAMLGLGQWGALLTGLTSAVTSVGTTLLTTKIQSDTAKNLAKKSAAADAAIAKAQVDAALATQKLMADAQAQAAAQRAPVYKSAIMWGGISLTVIAGLTSIYFIRKARKK
jgi:hypothetical protein